MFDSMITYFKTMWEFHKIVCGSSAFFISSIALDPNRNEIAFQDFSYNCNQNFVAHMRSVIKHEFLDYERLDNDNCKCVHK